MLTHRNDPAHGPILRATSAKDKVRVELSSRYSSDDGKEHIVAVRQSLIYALMHNSVCLQYFLRNYWQTDIKISKIDLHLDMNITRG